MIRNADLMLSASILSTAASEAGLAKLSPSLFRSSRGSARAARAIKLALFDFPVVFYFVGLNHEWGHQARGTEYGVDSHLSITGGPWSAQQFRLVAWSALPEESPATAAVHGGGLEASRTLKDRSEVRMLRGERVLPGHALAAIVSSLDSPVYALHNLSPHRFADGQLEGDVSTLAMDLFRRRNEVGQETLLEDVRSHIRARTALNLLDTALWSETYGLLADHVWRGEPSVRIRWLRLAGIDVMPSLRYELSPLGPEYYVRSHYRALGTTGTVYGRWTERIGVDCQIGGGFSVSPGPVRRNVPGTSARLTPRLSLDAWSHTVDGFGMRGEVEVDVHGWPARRAALTVAAGAKSAGYLSGFSMDRGAYVTAGVNLIAW